MTLEFFGLAGDEWEGGGEIYATTARRLSARDIARYYRPPHGFANYRRSERLGWIKGGISSRTLSLFQRFTTDRIFFFLSEKKEENRRMDKNGGDKEMISRGWYFVPRGEIRREKVGSQIFEFGIFESILFSLDVIPMTSFCGKR